MKKVLTTQELATKLSAIYETLKNVESFQIWIACGTRRVNDDFFFEVVIENNDTNVKKTFIIPVFTPREVSAANYAISEPYWAISKCKLADIISTAFDRAASGDLGVFGGNYYDSDKPLSEWYDNI